jgi:hypothetical protein
MEKQLNDLILVSKESGEEFIFPVKALDTQKKIEEKILDYVLEAKSTQNPELLERCNKIIGILLNQRFSTDPRDCQEYYIENGFKFPTRRPEDRYLIKQSKRRLR